MRRIISVGIAVLTVALTVVAAPAFADEVTDADVIPDEAVTVSDVKPDKAAAIAPFDFPEVDHAVALHCRGEETDRGPVVGCSWRADEHLEVASWQLWRLQIRPAGDERTLVAELGADVTSYVDTTVRAPAAYLYVVLGLNRAGEIIARSRPDLARVVEHRPAAIPLACGLQRAVSDTAVVSEISDVVEPAFEPAIGCRWEQPDHADVRGYVVHRVVDGGRRTVIAEVGADTTSIVDRDVAFGHRYTYVVSAFDGDGNVVAHSRAVTVGVPPWPFDRVTDHPIDRVTDHQTDRVTDDQTDRRSDRVTDHQTDPVTDQTDRRSDRVTDHQTDRRSDRVTDHPNDQVTDRVTDQATDASANEETDSASDSDMREIDHDRVVDAIADRESDLERSADRLPTDR